MELLVKNYARSNNIPYSKNYNFTIDEEIKDKDSINKLIMDANKDNIYLVRYLYVSDDSLSAYNMYIKNGISIIIEDVPFIYDKIKNFLKEVMK